MARSHSSLAGLASRRPRPGAAWRRVAPAALALLGVAAAARRSSAQVVDFDLHAALFHEASPTSAMTVLAPGASLGVTPVEGLRVGVGWEADIVSGATESVKAGRLALDPDIVSAASIDDTRHVFTGNLAVERGPATLAVGYGQASESDYRSRSITVSASTDLLQRNTQLALAYARGFDEVCDRANPVTRDPTVRLPLDTSDGCFTEAPERAVRDVALDTLQVGWTQSWTPVFVTQLVFSGGLQHGFLGNPYRSVVIGAGGQTAQEHHPENRARGAVAGRGRYWFRDLDLAVGVGGRAYRDTWDLLSGSYELEAEHYLAPWLRVGARARYYHQTGTLFFSDDYTGGEPVLGPRGQYWTGDRELSPLHSYLVGAKLVGAWKGGAGRRVGSLFTQLRTVVAVDFVDTRLEQFTWAGREPDDGLAILTTVGLSGGF
ncbi:MAG: DUF3570 domain-containing protein [Polyangiaceae bacterium]|nr:DUF3570 domain-containing protein [Polyangiaceae bacterium]